MVVAKTNLDAPILNPLFIGTTTNKMALSTIATEGKSHGFAQYSALPLNLITFSKSEQHVRR